MPHDRGVQKEAKDLARRVNAVGEGWTARRVAGGGSSHGGRAYEVAYQGRVVCRFSGNPSVPSLAFARAEAEIRRNGCPLPRKGVTPKKEEVMAAPTADEKERSKVLRPRIEAALNDRFGGDHNAMIARAMELIEENPGLDQFGQGASSSPREIAWNGLTRFLEGGSFKEPNLERWGYVLDRMNGAEAVPAAAPAAAPEPKPEPEEPFVPPTYEALEAVLAEEREARVLAESVVADIEKERDDARNDVARFQAQLDQVEEARSSLVVRADKLEKRAGELATRADKLEEDLAKAAPASGKKLEQAREQLAEALKRERAARDESQRLVNEAMSEPIVKLRAELGAVLVAQLKATDGEPGIWLLSRLDALAELVPEEGS